MGGRKVRESVGGDADAKDRTRREGREGRTNLSDDCDPTRLVDDVDES